jgi:hypothetical protein
MIKEEGGVKEEERKRKQNSETPSLHATRLYPLLKLLNAAILGRFGPLPLPVALAIFCDLGNFGNEPIHKSAYFVQD